MDTVLLIARLILAAVFVVAGATKLANRAGTKQTLVDFGTPAVLATPLAVLLPLAELTTATVLVPTPTAWWGAIGALALLLLFIVGIGINLARGHKPECHCFGQLHSAPAGWSTLVRNGALAALAGFVVWQGYDGAGPSAVDWIGDLSTAQGASLIVGAVVLGLVGAQWWFMVHLLRQNGRLLVRLEALEAGGGVPSPNGSQPPPGLPVGSMAPTFNLSGLYGEMLTLEALRAGGKPVVLLFSDPNCGPCTAMLPEIGRWQKEHSEKLTISLISRGTPEENRAKTTEHGLTNVLLQDEWEVSEVYQVRGTPSAVLVQPDGVISSPVMDGAEGIRALIAHAVGERAQLPLMQPQAAQEREPCPNCGKVHPAEGHAQHALPAGPKVGESAPETKLEDLEGSTVELKDFKGEEILVLFWNPGCGFCQQMLPDLKQWEEDSPEGAPKLLIVSAGALEATEEMGLDSPVLLDQQFATGRAFGVSGTPSAVLVDEEGKIASEVAVGAPAVLGLAGASPTKEA